MKNHVFACVTLVLVPGAAFADAPAQNPAPVFEATTQTLTLTSPECVKTTIVSDVSIPSELETGVRDTIELSYCLEAGHSPYTIATSQ